MGKTNDNAFKNGKYYSEIKEIFLFAKSLKNLLKSKIYLQAIKYEQIVAVELNHNINSEQGGRAEHMMHLMNSVMNLNIKCTWKFLGFQDISDDVLKILLNKRVYISNSR